MVAAVQQKQQSRKWALINRDNTVMLVAVAIASSVLVLSLFAIRSLYPIIRYNDEVKSQKGVALKTAQQNNKSIEKLQDSYSAFANQTVNVLGGSATGTGPLDGDNAKIVLDALPSKYDYPALISSIEKLIVENNYVINEVGGEESTTDEFIASSATPTVVEIPAEFSLSSDFPRAAGFLTLLERSIRPMNVRQLNISGSDQLLKLEIILNTYYQPEKIFDVTTKVVQ